MKTPNYYEYLNQMAARPQSSAEEYGSLLKENLLINSFCHLVSGVIFLLDLETKQYSYLGDSMNVVGHPREAFLEGGLEFMLQHYHTKDLSIYSDQIFPNRLDFLAHQAEQTINQVRFTHNYRYQMSNGQWHNLLQHVSFIPSKADGKPVAIFGVVFDITNYRESGKVIHQIEECDACGLWTPILIKQFYPDVADEELLSKREIEILKWVQEGNTSQMIADKLFISYHTVTTHRKNMLAKTNTKNGTELINFAVANGML